MLIHTLHQSLSFDTILKTHATRIDAETYMAKVLREYGGWPAADAVRAARNGTPVLVQDDGHDETIEIRETRSLTGDTKDHKSQPGRSHKAGSGPSPGRSSITFGLVPMHHDAGSNAKSSTMV